MTSSGTPPFEAYPGEEPFLFASYSHADRDVVYPELTRLHQQGFRIWYDEGIRPSSDWTEEIASALGRCSLFVVFLSPAAIQSRHVLDEIHFALERGKMFLAIHIAEVTLPDKLLLQMGRIQAVYRHRLAQDQYQRQLARWLPSDLLQPLPPVGRTSAAAVPQTSAPVSVPSFHYGSVVPPAYFIGRERELAEANQHIRAGQGFLLIGPRRAGKTSFCSKLIHQIMSSPGNDILAAYVNLQQYAQLTIETFLEHTMLNLVGEIARQVFRCKYSDLFRLDPAERHENLRADPEFASFVEIVRRVTERTHTRHGVSPTPLLAQEFIQFYHDLIECLRAKGWNRCLVVYDEANRLPRDLSVELLVSNEETLTAAGVVSIYAASPEMAETFQALREAFGQHVRMGPFRTPTDLQRLLARYCSPDGVAAGIPPVETAAVELLWRLSRGMPFLIQLLAGTSFRLAHEGQCSTVTAEHVELARSALLDERPGLFDSAGGSPP